MCAIVGAIVMSGQTKTAVQILNHIYMFSHNRGRDGRGYAALFNEEITQFDGGQYIYKDINTIDGLGLTPEWPLYGMDRAAPELLSFIGNLRAEPTTEYVRHKTRDDQQPYRSGAWTIVHNGTVANDKELRAYDVNTKIDSAAIAEVLNTEHNRVPGRSYGDVFDACIKKIKGSFAVLATCKHSSELYFACNYRPIWYLIVKDVGIFFASSRYYFPADYGSPQMLPPYSIGSAFITHTGQLGMHHRPLKWSSSPLTQRALVVCSGGLDSVVAATYVKKSLGMKVTLLHFRYGSRAQGPEIDAVEKVARHLGVQVIYQDIGVYRPEDSPLLRKDSKIAGGEAGAEFAHEWVPARNLLMLSMATAIAEARGFDKLVLGNNLEEAGAYPDNEPEFIDRFNDMLPFAIGDGKSLKVEMPVGNMMKHEIVALGLKIGAPMQHTWSCYRAGAIHCGTCGPCFMRRTAFEINGQKDPITYASDK